jgi:hypothetical protein
MNNTISDMRNFNDQEISSFHAQNNNKLNLTMTAFDNE